MGSIPNPKNRITSTLAIQQATRAPITDAPSEFRALILGSTVSHGISRLPNASLSAVKYASALALSASSPSSAVSFSTTDLMSKMADKNLRFCSPHENSNRLNSNPNSGPRNKAWIKSP